MRLRFAALFLTLSFGLPAAAMACVGGASPMMENLYQNIPNPFNPTTSIPYMLEMGRRVEIGIYDVSGSRVVVLNEGMQSPGTHTAIWNGRDQSGRAVPSGVYFYRFEGIPDAVGSRKMVLLK